MTDGSKRAGPLDEYTERLNLLISPRQMDAIDRRASDMGGLTRSTMMRIILEAFIEQDSPMILSDPSIRGVIREHAEAQGLPESLATVDLILAGVRWYNQQSASGEP